MERIYSQHFNIHVLTMFENTTALQFRCVVRTKRKKDFDFDVTDTTGCDCRDKLSNTNTVSYSVTYSNGTTVSYTFTSCADLVDKAPQLCNKMRNDKCCESCKGGMSFLSLNLA